MQTMKSAVHKMKLNEVPFNCIKNKTKTIEMRLYDEKRQLLKENDYIEFTNITTQEKILTKIISLNVYSNFQELYSHYDKGAIGYASDEIPNPSDMEAFYSKEEQSKYGVVAIEIQVKDECL